jgi:phytoene/squalene synthetase
MLELFPSSVRPCVRAFGRFVRLADDITDSALLSRQDKLAKLTTLERCLDDGSAAVWSAEAGAVIDAMRTSLCQCTVSPEHARHVLQAFRRDAEGYTAATWRDILIYCQFAAAPIGRYMLQLMREDLAVCGRPTDALCAALRILRQLRDCRDPTIHYNRLCIPRQFLDDAMITPDHLRAPAAKGQTRAVLDRVLDGVEQLLGEASSLPRLIHHRGLVTHTSIVLCRARKLVTRFRHRDPLQERVGLAAWQRTFCRWYGTLCGLARC